MSLAPAAESISAAVTAISLRIARSFSLQAQWIFATGMPQASTLLRVELNEIFVTGKALAKSAERRFPRGRAAGARA